MPEAWHAEAALRNSDDRAFAPVDAAELEFALSLFVAAANSTLTCSGHQGDAAEDATERQGLFRELLVHKPAVPPCKVLPYHASLFSAFSALWTAYQGHAQRDAICARVLCFHFLMERTEGRAVGPWTSASPRAEEILLDPAVVEGLAVTTLSAGKGLHEAELVAAIARCARHTA